MSGRHCRPIIVLQPSWQLDIRKVGDAENLATAPRHFWSDFSPNQQDYESKLLPAPGDGELSGPNAEHPCACIGGARTHIAQTLPHGGSASERTHMKR